LGSDDANATKRPLPLIGDGLTRPCVGAGPASAPPGICSTFNTYLYAERDQEFIASLPAEESARTTFYRGLGYYYLKDFARAADEFDHAYELDPSLLHAQFGRAFAYAIRGQRGEGIRFLSRVEQAARPHDGEMLYKIAQAYAVLGDRPSALRLLRQSIEHNFYCYPYFVRDPMLESLRTSPDYSALMELARQRHEAFRRKFF
jgi:tetratricopeptide (TPR) repeat protein